MTERFAEAVERKVEQVTVDIATGRAVDGWAKGPLFICDQAGDEPIDVAGWLRGLDEFPKPPGAEDLIATIVGDAALLYDAIDRLRQMYED